jgi:uncharacterized membrane protein (UPF0127 family)
VATLSRYLLQTASDPSGIALDVEVPTTHRERARGLLGRRPVPMLFERARSVHTFGMREEIVVAFLDRDYRVIRVATVPPRRIVWSVRARHVLEMPADARLSLGDRLSTAPAASR